MPEISNANVFLSLRPNPQARIRLFCFPNAGGGVSTLYSWLRGLPPEIQLCPIQLPGRENRRLETPFTRITALVDTLAGVLQPHLDFPFAFFGHSLGSLVAFELARELRRRALPEPVHLLVSARSAPQIPIPGPPVHHLPDTQFVAELCSRYKAIPPAILADSELMRLIIPVMRADMEMIETYRFAPGDPVRCPLSAFGGTEDAQIGQPDLDAWRQHTLGAFDVRMFPGDHFFPRTSQAALLDVISRALISQRV